MRQALPWVLVVAAVLLMLDVGDPSGNQPVDPEDPLPLILGDPGLHVVEMDAADVPMDCPVPTTCDSDYRAFLERVAERRSPRDAGQLLSLLAELDPAVALPTEADLAVVAAREAGLDFLLEGLDERELLVVERSNEAGSGIQQIRLALEDPFVGVVEALFLVPGTGAPWSGLVVHPGGDGSLDSGRDAVDGAQLARSGVAVVVVQPRIDGGDALESELSLSFLNAGVSLVGVRAYEVLLARKYLRWRADVLPDRLALVVGPGAAEVGDLAARTATWVAYAGPARADWLALTSDGRPSGATVPGLVGLGTQLTDDGTLGIPVRRHEPGAPPLPAEVAAFIRGEVLPPPVQRSDLDPGPAVGADLR